MHRRYRPCLRCCIWVDTQPAWLSAWARLPKCRDHLRQGAQTISAANEIAISAVTNLLPTLTQPGLPRLGLPCDTHKRALSLPLETSINRLVTQDAILSLLNPVSLAFVAPRSARSPLLESHTFRSMTLKKRSRNVLVQKPSVSPLPTSNPAICRESNDIHQHGDTVTFIATQLCDAAATTLPASKFRIFDSACL